MVTLGPVLAAPDATDVLGRAPVELRDLAYDTRALTPGSLFFCVPGAHVDGHDLAAEAVTRGAVALVVERPVDAAVPPLLVPPGRAPLAAPAGRVFRPPAPGLPGPRRARA